MIDYDKIVYVDIDDTIEDLLFAWVKYLNEKYNLSVNVNDCKAWDLCLLFPMLTEKQIVDALWDVELWKDIKPIDGAIEYLQKLQEDGFDVYLATATHVSYYNVKYEHVINKYFPFIPEDHIITIHNKQLLKGLVLIDDYIENLKDAEYYGILFTSYYNKDIDVTSEENIVRAYNWKDCYNWIKSIYHCRKEAK